MASLTFSTLGYLFHSGYWKIAGLWPAIFKGTPGNLEAYSFGMLHLFSILKS